MKWTADRRMLQSEQMKAVKAGTYSKKAAPERNQGWNKIVVPDSDVRLIMALVDERAALRARLSELHKERQRVLFEMGNLTNKKIAEKFEYTERQIDNIVNSARGANVR